MEGQSIWGYGILLHPQGWSSKTCRPLANSEREKSCKL